MGRRRICCAWALACLLAAAPGFAGAGEAGVTATVEPGVGVVGRGLTLRVTVPGRDTATIDVPDMADWTVIPRGRALGARGEDGEPVSAYRFELVPRRAGTLAVPALTVETGGARTQTPPLAVRVRPRPAPPAALAGQDAFLDATVSEENPYVGQAFVYTVRLYRAVPAAGVSLAPPAFAGCVADPLPGQRDGEARAGGKAYVTAEVDYLLAPLRAGTLAIAPPEARIRGLGKASGETVLAGPQRAVAVRPLPPYAGAAPFTGLVGRMALQSRLAADAGSGEAVYELTLSGRGNLDAAAPPALSLPPGLSARALPGESAVQPTLAGPEGERTFHYALTAATPGTFTLPAVSLAVFDPEEGRYVIVEAPPRAFVAAPQGAPAPVAPPLSPVSSGRGMSPDRAAWAESLPWRVAFGICPPLLFVLTFLPRRRRRVARATEAQEPAAVAESLRRALRAAEDASRAPCPEAGAALARLDRLLYSGEECDAAALDAARDQGLAVLRRLAP
jgi:hypothetical protein